MSVDHSLPTLTTPYADFLTTLDTRIEDVARAFFGTDYSNIPVSSMRYDRLANLWQEWDGSSFSTRGLSVAGGGTGVSSIADLKTALSLDALAYEATIDNSDWSGAALSVANGGTGVNSLAAFKTAMNLTSLAEQPANNVAITGGSITSLSTFTLASATISTALTTPSVTSTAALSLNSASGSNILFKVGGVPRVEMPSSGGGGFWPATDNAYSLGFSGAHWSAVYSAKFYLRNPTNFYLFPYTVRTSLSPSAATASDCADSINTIFKYLETAGLATTS